MSHALLVIKVSLYFAKIRNLSLVIMFEARPAPVQAIGARYRCHVVPSLLAIAALKKPGRGRQQRHIAQSRRLAKLPASEREFQASQRPAQRRNAELTFVVESPADSGPCCI